MKKAILWFIVLFACTHVFADTFGTGENQFDIDFVPISSSTNPASGYGFVGYDYRIGIYEITNDHWIKFKAELSPVLVKGYPSEAYNETSYWADPNFPTNEVSWFEAAQFVNWLNTSTGHQAAYKFTGTQGTSNYTFGLWEEAEAWGGTNLFRHKDAYYFLPSEDEWVKAAYWNSNAIQTYATIGDLPPVAGVDANYDYAIGSPWDVGVGSEELNGTFDMMGNVWEWMESPYLSEEYTPSYNTFRAIRGGSYYNVDGLIRLSSRDLYYPYFEYSMIGFRVASVFEPCPTADITGDCFVDLEDLAELASQWLTGRQ